MSTEPVGAGRQVWAVLELLDRQLVDREGRLVGKVDDVEFELPDDPGGLPRVTALLAGLGALANHIGGDTGAALAAAERRLAERARPPSVARRHRDRARDRVGDRARRRRATTSTRTAANAGCATSSSTRSREPAMLLSDLLGVPVVTIDGDELGRVHDVVLVQDGPMGATGPRRAAPPRARGGRPFARVATRVCARDGPGTVVAAPAPPPTAAPRPLVRDRGARRAPNRRRPVLVRSGAV